MLFLNYNGRIHRSDEPVLLADNKGYRYGDGLFETMRVTAGRILFEEQHRTRLNSGMELLRFRFPETMNWPGLREEILALCAINGLTASARVRLSVFRGHGGLWDMDNTAGYLLETWALEAGPGEWQVQGLVVGFPDAPRKTADRFSGLKSANYLPYTMAALSAREFGWDDSILLNTAGRVCDSCIANIFLIRDGAIRTPPLSEGPVDGVKRRFLLDHASELDLQIREEAITVEDLLGAEELFLTNVIRGIRWIETLGDKKFSGTITRDIHNRVQGLIKERYNL